MGHTTYKKHKSLAGKHLLGVRRARTIRNPRTMGQNMRRNLNVEISRMVNQFGPKTKRTIKSRGTKSRIPAALRGLNASLVQAASVAIAAEKSGMNTNNRQTRRSSRIAIKRVANAEKKAVEDAKIAQEKALQAEKKAAIAEKKAMIKAAEAEKKAVEAQKRAEISAMYNELANLMERQLTIKNNSD